MKIVIMRAMRGEYPSMDVYADGLSEGLKAVFPDWEIVEEEPEVRFNRDDSSRIQRAITGVFRYWDRFWKYPRRIASLNADIVHIISDHHFQVARLLRGTKTRSVATCHDLIYYRFRKNIEQYARFVPISRQSQEYSMRSLRFCDHIITLSQNNVVDLQTFVGVDPKKITVVHNAVSTYLRPPNPGERERARNRLGFGNKFCVLHVGTVEPRKNVDSILKAIVRLRNEDVLFIKTSKNFTEAQQSLITAEKIEDSIRFLGKLSNEELLSLYHACDALVFPSLYEGFPFPIGEAMGADLPVITSTTGSLPEVADGAAILVDPLKIDQIVKAICDLKNNPDLRASQIVKGRSRVAKLTWTANARAVGAVYERCLKTT